MNVAVIVFPGTNCERDVTRVLRDLGMDADLAWHTDDDLSGANGVVLPGGFAHGDYLRPGAIARLSPVMAEVRRLADTGAPVLGICNGFQVLCEAGMLPGALVANRRLRFLCAWINVRVQSTHSILTAAAKVGDVLRIPLNSYEGNFVAPTAELDDLEARGGAVLRYCDEHGDVGPDANLNGSMNSIAAVVNDDGNVAGIMPHPERASDELLGSSSGRILLQSFAMSLSGSPV